ncbi:MAG: hypothetical protein UR78_C0028G0008 [Candidatus Moranbacteria bacterium GW2011_GWF2_35_39]|nr:MAG: hypothetical protein UR78_C0028G0008 [Candidatus Moranbacteria bacterium GW2011_GWF2_35_39]
METKIIDWKQVCEIQHGVGINNEQYENVCWYEPIFEGEQNEQSK